LTLSDTEPVCKCNGGLPQCYVCNGTSRQDCKRWQVLETCPSHEVCLHWHFLVI